MKVIAINGQNFLASSVQDTTALQAMSFRGDSVTLTTLSNYIKSNNLKTLNDISFGNATTLTRELDHIEKGYLAVVEATFLQASETALASVINARMDELLGKS